LLVGEEIALVLAWTERFVDITPIGSLAPITLVTSRQLNQIHNVTAWT
jgi:hypothetical protein